MMDKQQQLQSVIMALVRKRGSEKTICPSEAARAFSDDNWRQQMEAVREAASELQAQNRIRIEQGGESVELDKVSGPIRLRLREGADE
jgi:hypothetical protein